MVEVLARGVIWSLNLTIGSANVMVPTFVKASPSLYVRRFQPFRLAVLGWTFDPPMEKYLDNPMFADISHVGPWYEVVESPVGS